MSDYEHLLAAVILHRDADLPRLLVADYLDDRGQPGDAERAEFVRRQIAGEVVRVRLTALVPFEGVLGAQPHQCLMMAGRGVSVVTSPAGVELRFSRGFVSAVTCSWADWTANADALAWCPRPCGKCVPDAEAYAEMRAALSRPVSFKAAKPPRSQCPVCRGSGVVPPTDECPACKDGKCKDNTHGGATPPGRVPRPCPATAMPLERVTLTDPHNIDWCHRDGAVWLYSGPPPEHGTTPAAGRRCRNSTAGDWLTVEAGVTYVAALVAAEWPGIEFRQPSVTADPRAYSWSGIGYPEQTTAQTAPGSTGPA